MPKTKTLVVIGGGAAGFFCAVNAARLEPGLQVILLEKTEKLLSKVKVSGGGRCNVTHSCFNMAEMIKKYPRGSMFLKKAFIHFFTTDTIKWFEERGVPLKTESDGRMFPQSNTSQTIIDCLMDEAKNYGVAIHTKTEVTEILKADKGFIVQTNNTAYTADFICLASGGYPKEYMFNWMAATGHSIEKPVPSLFTFNLADKRITALMGLSVENVLVKINNSKWQTEGPLLITHWGLSGPAVLKLSAFAARELYEAQYHFYISINWLPGNNEQSLKEKILQLRFQLSAQKIINRNPFNLPQRLWAFILNECEIAAECRWAELPAKQQNKLCQLLTHHVFEVKGKTTFKEEFVTCGGISLSNVNPQTMESWLVPQLYFAGEVLDIDGITGGFNFQNAWTTGWLAAKSIAEAV